MPIYSFECKNEHHTEEILSFAEQNKLIQEHGKVVVQCPECGEMSEKIISLTANMNKQWQEQAK